MSDQPEPPAPGEPSPAGLSPEAAAFLAERAQARAERAPHPLGTLVLVLGVLGLVLAPMCPLLNLAFAIPALVYGHRARREVAADRSRYRDTGRVTAGWILGIAGTLLGIAFTVVWAVAASS